MAIRFLANINQPAPGSEPYLTDLSSITLLKDLLPGFNVSSNPRGFTLLPDGRVVFGAFNGSTTELWITNGTEAGTVRVADLLITDPVGTNPQFLTRVGDSIYYSGLGDDGQELWRVSATTSVRVKDINPSGDSNPEGLTALPNNTFLFSANDGSHGVELWVSDGTSTNTT